MSSVSIKGINCNATGPSTVSNGSTLTITVTNKWSIRTQVEAFVKQNGAYRSWTKSGDNIAISNVQGDIEAIVIDPARWTEPVFDRTAEDVRLRTKKGFMNIEDIDRIIEDYLHVHGLLCKYWIRTDEWEATYALFRLNSEIQTNRAALPLIDIVNNIGTNIERTAKHMQAIDSALYSKAAYLGYQAPRHNYIGGKQGTTPDYSDINVWEHDLEILHRTIEDAYNARTYCGDGGGSYFCGDWKRGGLI